MADSTELLYLEPDDEITSVVRRLREADGGRVVMVAPGRSRVTASAVALRLLAGVAAEDGREIALVADPAGRALAAEAGIPAFPSVAEANAEDPVPPAPPPARRAPIRVVRGEEARVATLAPVEAPGSMEETMAVPVAPPGPPPEAPTPARAPSGPGPARRPRAPRPTAGRGRALSRAAIGAVVVLLLLAAAGVAAVAPAATVVIEPVSEPIEPARYTLALPADDIEEGELSAETQGSATGVFRDPTAATGVVVFSNWNTSSVRVDAGTQVAAGEVVFVTEETIVVPTGFFGIPGTAEAAVVAVERGPVGNLPASAIDTILDEDVRDALRAFSDNPNRLVENPEPTAGGSDNEQPKITRQDVNRAVEALQADLEAQLESALSEEPGILYAPVDAAEPEVEIPDDLVGRTGEETFSLAGTMTYRRARVTAEAVENAARDRLLDDAEAAPPNRAIVEDSIEVDVRRVTREGDTVEARVTVAALADPIVDTDTVRGLVAGLTAPEAEEALAELGRIAIDLWPGWVDRVPQLEWRIDVQVTTAEASVS